MLRNDITIAVITSGHTQIDDGRVFQRCSKPLARAGYSVIQIGPYGTGFEEERNGVQIRGFTPRIDYKLKHRWNPLWQLFKMTLKTPAKVYHCHELDALLVGLIIGFFRRSKVIYDCHEITSRVFAFNHFRGIFRTVVNILVRSGEKFLYFLADATIVPSEPVKTQFNGLIKKNIIILPNLPSRENTKNVNIELLKNSQKEYYQGIFIGRPHFRRGIIPALKAGMLLREQGSYSLKIKIVGSGNVKFNEFLRNFIRENDLEEWVYYKPSVPYAKMWDEMAEADFGFLLDPPIPENLHNPASKFYEYLSAGLPVLLSDLPINRKMVAEDNLGILSDPVRKVKIAEAFKKMIELIQREGDEIRMRTRKTFEEKYCWELYEPKLISLYDSLTNNY